MLYRISYEHRVGVVLMHAFARSPRDTGVSLHCEQGCSALHFYEPGVLLPIMFSILGLPPTESKQLRTESVDPTQP